MAGEFSEQQIGEFVAAAERGDIEHVAAALRAGCPVDAAVEGGFRALYLASERGQASVVRALLEAGADPGLLPKTTSGGWVASTALHQAIESGSAEVIDLLLDHGANPRTPNSELATSAHLLLLRALKFVNRPGGEESLSRLLGKMLDLGVPINQQMQGGRVLLALAMADGLPYSIAERLVERGAELRASDGTQLLHMAVKRGRADLVRLLVKHGADINGVDSQGCGVLWWSNSAEIDRVLLDLGADVNIVDIYGKNVLFHRLQEMMPLSGVPLEIEVLITAGVDVDAKAFRGALSARDLIKKGRATELEAMIQARDARAALRRTAARGHAAKPS